jgi:hypothetical protein
VLWVEGEGENEVEEVVEGVEPRVLSVDCFLLIQWTVSSRLTKQTPLGFDAQFA